jgi:hypothetical protein
VVLQAPLFDGLPFDVGTEAQDVRGAGEVGVGRRNILQALVIAGLPWFRIAITPSTMAVPSMSRERQLVGLNGPYPSPLSGSIQTLS